MSPRQTPNSANLLLAAILVLLTAPLPAWPQGAGAARIPKAEDERLKQVVTSHVVDEPLRAWLDHLTQETGVRLQAASDYEDRALTVRVKAMPLGELMEAVASLYGDNWRLGRKKEDADYVLEASQDRRSRQRRFQQTYQNVLVTEHLREANDIVRFAEASFDNLPEPERSFKRREYQGKARGKVVALLGPEILTRLLSGETFAVRVADTTGALGDALRELVGTYAMPSLAGWTAQDQDAAWVVFSSDSYTVNPAPEKIIDVGYPLRDITMAIGPPSGAVRGTAVSLPDGQLYEQMTKGLAPLHRDEEQDPRERHREGGALLQRVLPAATQPADGPYAERSQMLLAIADAADVNLIADSHTKPKRLTPPLKDRSVEEALTAVGDLWQSAWRTTRGTILVRSRNWWVDDPAEPPATAMARWQAKFAADGLLPLEDAARIAALSREQQQRLLLRIPEARAAFHPWLRFYAGLSATQQEAMRSPQGLELQRLSGPERRQLLTAYFRGGLLPKNAASAETLASGQAVLKLREEVREGRSALIFAYAPREPGSSTTVWLPYRTGAHAGKAGGRGAH